jgi:hypothetical protein
MKQKLENRFGGETKENGRHARTLEPASIAQVN